MTEKMVMSMIIWSGEIPEPMPDWLFESWQKGCFSFAGPHHYIIMPDGTLRPIRAGDHIYMENDERPYLIPRECIPNYKDYLNYLKKKE